MLKINLFPCIWPIRGEFRLSRGSRTEVHTLQMEISDGISYGIAEAVPYAHYNETIISVMEQVRSIQPALETHVTHRELTKLLPAGAARNLCDLALWDYEAKSSGNRVWQLAGMLPPANLLTAYTLSLDTPEVMAAAALKATAYPLLKLKLGTPDDIQRLEAIKIARPDARLIVDANEGWSISQLRDIAPVMHNCGVVLCEQPLPVADDDELAGTEWPFLVCADESIHTASDISALVNRYQAVNIKLDKTGGLTEALETMQMARQHNLQIMIGCMLASSLAMAPAVLLANEADWVDLDGPLLLAADHVPALEYDGAMLTPPKPALWG